MPIKIKISLTIYIIIIAISVMFYEKLLGQPELIYTLIFVTTLMIIGIWIFPEVVTKKLLQGLRKIKKKKKKVIINKLISNILAKKILKFIYFVNFQFFQTRN